MASYYQRFIPNFARIAQPIHQLTAKDVNFTWSMEAESAFTSLKVKLTTPLFWPTHVSAKTSP